jgi:hypothetical protein
MLNYLLPALFLLVQDPAPAPPATAVAVEAPVVPAGQETPAAPAPAAPTPAEAKPAAVTPAAKGKDLKPLSFLSQEFKFRWDQYMALGAEVDGLKINSIFFNKRTMPLFKGAEFGTRAVVEVTNTSSDTRTPGFAVAVFDADNRLLGVASGGPKIGGVSAGATETFDLSFHQVVERIPRADHFILAVELTN